MPMEDKQFELIVDELIVSIEFVLSRNRSSLSVDDVTRLEKCIISLKELKKVSSDSDRKNLVSELILPILKTFLRPEVVETIMRILEELDACN